MGSSASSLAGKREVKSLSREGGGIEIYAEDKGGATPKVLRSGTKVPGRLSSVVSIETVEAERLLNEDVKVHDDENIYEIIEANVCDSSDEELDREDSDDENEEENLHEARNLILADAAALGKLASDFLHPEFGVSHVHPTCFGRNYFDRSISDAQNIHDIERIKVLEETRALKKLASDYYHPEVGVTATDPTCFGRNYFNGTSEVEDVDEEERAQVLAESVSLKKLASDYHHPEVGVTNGDPTCFARNYFNGTSDGEEVDKEERAQILAEAAALKKLASDYHHPEVGVTNTDPTSFGRNYFNDISEVEEDDDEERAQVLAEAASLKKLASDYHHPEVGVTNADPTCFGRNYFHVASDVEEVDEEERAQVLAEAAALKKLASDYHHPEVGMVNTDPTSFGRNYFNRDSEVDEERAQVLAEATALKKLASDYHHPEVGVSNTDPTCFGRNYFNGTSEAEDVDEEERAQVLAEAAALKKLASDYHHPEVGVSTADPTCFGRNYFHVASDVKEVDEEERAQVLAEAAALKKLASDYHHPEVGVANTDPTCFGRNYFYRSSEAEEVDEEERAQVLAEAASLKQLASDYHHPEVGVTNADPTCFGKNYFLGGSDDEEVDEEERAQVLAEAAALKKLASDYHHPEVGVSNTDPTCFGRNYFNGTSDIGEVEEEERAQVLAEAASLKQLASDYHHPEVGVISADLSCFGRNYFNDFAEVQDVDEEERAQVLAEAAALKKLASDYHHPEVGVTNTDPTCFGRNYFNGTSEAEDVDEEERAQVLAEAGALKKLASDYYHPEVGVTVTDPTCFGRNYFNGTSDIGEVDEEERAQILAEAASLKKLASDHYHPEVGATSSDPTCFGRNYFDRDSEVAEVDEEERAQILAEAASLKKLASDYHHPEIGVKSTDPTCRGRNFYTRSTAVESSDDYVKRVLSDAAALKKYALDHHHPEIKVQTTDPMCYARNFFSRSSVGDDGEIVVYNEPQYVEEAYSNFEFDEDVNNEETLGNLKDAVYEIGLHDNTFQDKDEGNLSRSPSSVMLFEEC